MAQRWLGLVAAAVTALGSTACAPSRIVGMQVLSSRAGESLLIEARSSSSSFGVSYLRRHSLENGALLASASIWHSDRRSLTWHCIPALPGRLWCKEFGGGLRLRDAESLEIIATEDQMLRGVPEAVRPRWGIIGPAVQMGPEKIGYTFESRDGYTWVVDPTTLASARYPGPVIPLPSPETSYPPPVDTYTLGKGTRGPLERREVVLHPEHTYLDGRIVAGLDDPPRVLVTERVPDHGPTLWCLFADGSVQWKVTPVAEDESAQVRVVKLYRDTIVLATYTKLMALRAQDGAVVWTSPP